MFLKNTSTEFCLLHIWESKLTNSQGANKLSLHYNAKNPWHSNYSRPLSCTKTLVKTGGGGGCEYHTEINRTQNKNEKKYKLQVKY